MSAVVSSPVSPINATWIPRPSNLPPGSSLAKLSSGFRIDSGTGTPTPSGASQMRPQLFNFM